MSNSERYGKERQASMLPGKRGLWIAGACGGAVVAMLLLYGVFRPHGAEDHVVPVAPEAPGASPISQSAPKPDAPAAPVMPDEASSEVRDLGLVTGERLTYQVNHMVQVKTEMQYPDHMTEAAGPLEPQTVEIRQSLAGNMIVDVLADLFEQDDETRRGWLIEARLQGIHTDISADHKGGSPEPDPGTLAEIMNQLDREIMGSRIRAEVLTSGEVGKLVAADAGPEVRNQWRAILACWQVVLPETPETNEWETLEMDGTGTYVARYHSSVAPGDAPKDAPWLLNKSKLRYTRLPSAPGEAGNLDIESQARIQLNPYQTLIEGTESIAVASPGYAIGGETHFSLRLISVDGVPDMPEDPAQLLAQFNSDTNLMTWTVEDYTDPGLAATPDEFEELIALLKNVLRFEGPESLQLVNLAGVMIQALQAGGDYLVDHILQALTDDMDDPDYCAILVGVLGAAQTDAAQRGLLELVDVEVGWPVEMHEFAYPALVQAPSPVPELEEILIRAHQEGPDEYRDTALLVLAANARILRDHDAERREHIVDYVQAQIDETDFADNENTLLRGLHVMGNLGPDGVPDFVLKATQHEDETIRAAALHSLRMSTAEDAPNLAYIGTKDEHPEVRTTALEVLAQLRGPGGLETLGALALNDPEDSVRLAALEGLVQHYWRNDETNAVLLILQAAAENDPSEELRTGAQERMAFVGLLPWEFEDELEP